jgi:hypothetical protein
MMQCVYCDVGPESLLSFLISFRIGSMWGFVVNKGVLGHVFLAVHQFSPVSIIHPIVHMLLVSKSQTDVVWEPSNKAVLFRICGRITQKITFTFSLESFLMCVHYLCFKLLCVYVCATWLSYCCLSAIRLYSGRGPVLQHCAFLVR